MSLLLTTGPRFARSQTVTALGRILDAYMDRHYISQSALSEALDVDASYLSRLRTGSRHLDHTQIPRWSAVLGVPEPDLVLASYGIDPNEYATSIRADERTRIIQEITHAEPR